MNKNTILTKVLESIFYSNSFKKATRMTSNSAGILQLLKNVLSKFQSVGTNGMLEGLKNKILTLSKLLKCYATGQYRQIEAKNLIIIIASLLYFLSPIDFIPDFLPVLGFADDIALITFVFSSVSEELEKFELWEINQKLNS